MNELLTALLEKFDDDERFEAVLLVGSAARGDLTKYSDIDLVFFAEEVLPEDAHEKYQLRYYEARLISLSVSSFNEAEESFENPLTIVMNMQGLRDGVVLRDSAAGTLEELKSWADKFRWTDELRRRADREASYHLMGNAEEVHKVLRGLSQADEGALLNGALGLALNMPMVVALKEGILSRVDNIFLSQVRGAVGEDSAWSRYHSLATGGLPVTPGYSPLAMQAIAAFWLYDETVRLADDVLRPEDREVVQTALGIAKESTLLPAIL